MENFLYAIGIVIIFMIIYDKYIQRKHQLLINYPLIGRMRYFLEAVREPFRQYFADETFYESKDKVDWVYGASYNHDTYVSFSPNQPQKLPKWLIKHANAPLNNDEVTCEFNVEFGKNREKPFITKSIVSRSAMSDGAISPEGTRAFSKGAYEGQFPINIGEGGLTSNFLFTHKPTNKEFLEIITITKFDSFVYELIKICTNRYIAVKALRNRYLPKGLVETYIFDYDEKIFLESIGMLILKNFQKKFLVIFQI